MKYVAVREAADVLRRGGVALVPTETVVGLVAADSGFSRLWEIKGRDAGKPIALLCESADQAFSLARETPPLARALAAAYWPGPLTLVLDAPEGGTVGVRVPDGSAVRELLAVYGGPLYATSANISGGPDVRNIEQVDPVVASAVDVAVRGEPGTGEASAVVDLSSGQVRLLRPTEDLSEARLRRFAELE
ncbi:MAG TPA: L-threonylcarbamoyladenylate synthase [Rubrobacteraceae bacterium]|nr:L-threonylcarbamoyladenylate synthase [Rubrobacteraceae bacterium]